jgi:hypothetical protein
VSGGRRLLAGGLAAAALTGAALRRLGPDVSLPRDSDNLPPSSAQAHETVVGGDA